ncbi:MAG: hypothetical protein NC930_08675, partial [Candidatus Omnitrophica bacterium]|nr:hypothetical protein [Candidatus Omnitrophota bacterium]
DFSELEDFGEITILLKRHLDAPSLNFEKRVDALSTLIPGMAKEAVIEMLAAANQTFQQGLSYSRRSEMRTFIRNAGKGLIRAALEFLRDTGRLTKNQSRRKEFDQLLDRLMSVTRKADYANKDEFVPHAAKVLGSPERAQIFADQLEIQGLTFESKGRPAVAEVPPEQISGIHVLTMTEPNPVSEQVAARQKPRSVSEEPTSRLPGSQPRGTGRQGPGGMSESKDSDDGPSRSATNLGGRAEARRKKKPDGNLLAVAFVTWVRDQIVARARTSRRAADYNALIEDFNLALAKLLQLPASRDALIALLEPLQEHELLTEQEQHRIKDTLWILRGRSEVRIAGRKRRSVNFDLRQTNFEAGSRAETRTVQLRISPSLLAVHAAAGEPETLSEELIQMFVERSLAAVRAGAASIHFDVVGQPGYVVRTRKPTITTHIFTPVLLRRIKEALRHAGFGHIPVDVHLMVEEKHFSRSGAFEQYLRDYIDAGAGSIALHIEGFEDESLVYYLGLIRDASHERTKPALALRPDFDETRTLRFLSTHPGDVDYVLQLSVDPGAGGQSFKSEVLDKLRRLVEAGYQGVFYIDGGVNPQTAAQIRNSGLPFQEAIAGSAVYGGKKVALERSVQALNQAIEGLAGRHGIESKILTDRAEVRHEEGSARDLVGLEEMLAAYRKEGRITFTLGQGRGIEIQRQQTYVHQQNDAPRVPVVMLKAYDTANRADIGLVLFSTQGALATEDRNLFDPQYDKTGNFLGNGPAIKFTEAYRGQGLGTLLQALAIYEAKQRGLRYFRIQEVSDMAINFFRDLIKRLNLETPDEDAIDFVIPLNQIEQNRLISLIAESLTWINKRLSSLSSDKVKAKDATRRSEVRTPVSGRLGASQHAFEMKYQKVRSDVRLEGQALLAQLQALRTKTEQEIDEALAAGRDSVADYVRINLEEIDMLIKRLQKIGNRAIDEETQRWLGTYLPLDMAHELIQFEDLLEAQIIRNGNPDAGLPAQPERVRHIQRAIRFFRALTAGNFDYYLRRLPKDVGQETRAAYVKNLEALKKIYDGLSEEDKKIIWLEVTLHDIGFATGVAGLGHESRGVGIAEGIMKNRLGIEGRIPEMVSRILVKHGYVGFVYLGEMRMPKFLEEADEELARFLLLHNTADAPAAGVDHMTYLPVQVAAVARWIHPQERTCVAESFDQYRLEKLARQSFGSPDL